MTRVLSITSRQILLALVVDVALVLALIVEMLDGR